MLRKIILSILIIRTLTQSGISTVTPTVLGGCLLQFWGQLSQNDNNLATLIINYYHQGTYTIVFGFRIINFDLSQSNNKITYLTIQGVDNSPTSNLIRYDLIDKTLTKGNDPEPTNGQLINGFGFNGYKSTVNVGSGSIFSKNKLYLCKLYYFNGLTFDNKLDGYTQYKEQYFSTFFSTVNTQGMLGLNRHYVGDFTVANQALNVNINLFTQSQSVTGPYFSLSLLMRFINQSDNQIPTQNISYWAGFSYSNSHVYRDMLIMEYLLNNNINITDGYSVLGMSPFSDASSNIGGRNDITIINSKSTRQYSFVQILRQFDTGDSEGDQILKLKLNNQYCLAFLFDNIYTNNIMANTKKHNILYCYDANPDLKFSNNQLNILITIGILISFLFI